MFTRYVTSGIAEEVGLDLQILLWSLIDIWKKEYKDAIDYLQVIELEVVEFRTLNIRVIHKKEVPLKEEEHNFLVSTPLEARIFCIDFLWKLSGASFFFERVLAEAHTKSTCLIPEFPCISMKSSRVANFINIKLRLKFIAAVAFILKIKVKRFNMSDHISRFNRVRWCFRLNPLHMSPKVLEIN